MEEELIGNEFRLRRKIGAGSFGEIYAGESIKTHRRVAIKQESIDANTSQLPYESKLYQILQGGIGIPNFYWFGKNHENHMLVIDLLGKSLETLFEKCNHRFSLKTVLMLAEQMISLIQFFHSKNLIHRDIKPDNFVVGFGSKSNQVFIIDYGLAKRYRNPFSNQHISFSPNKSLTGTARYASVNALKGNEQSRRDDLESLGYIFLYFLKGQLPWMGIKCQDQEEKFRLIGQVKEQTRLEDLCAGFPKEFLQYFHMIRNLEFEETPHYAEYRQLFRNLFINSGYSYDYKYDWIVTEIPSIHISPTLSEKQITIVDTEKSNQKEQDERPKRLELHRNQSQPLLKNSEPQLLRNAKITPNQSRDINPNKNLSKQSIPKPINLKNSAPFRSERDLLHYNQHMANPVEKEPSNNTFSNNQITATSKFPRNRGPAKLARNPNYIGNTDSIKSNKPLLRANSQTFDLHNQSKKSHELNSAQFILHQMFPSYKGRAMVNNDYVGNKRIKSSATSSVLNSHHSSNNSDFDLDSEKAVQKLIEESRIANQKTTPTKV